MNFYRLCVQENIKIHKNYKYASRSAVVFTARHLAIYDMMYCFNFIRSISHLLILFYIIIGIPIRTTDVYIYY